MTGPTNRAMSNALIDVMTGVLIGIALTLLVIDITQTLWT